MILDRYTTVLDDISTCLTRLQSVRSESQAADLAIKQATTDRDKLVVEKSDAMTTSRAEVIDMEIRTQRQPLESQRNSLQQEILQMQTKREVTLTKIRESNYNLHREESFRLVNECLAVIDQMSADFGTLVDETAVAIIQNKAETLEVNDAFLQALKIRVELSQTGMGAITQAPWIEKIARFVSIPEMRDGRTPSPLLTIIGLTAKVGVLLFGLTIFSIGLVVPYSLFIFKGVKTQTRNTNKLQELLYPYELLDICTRKYRDELLRICEQRKVSDINTTDDWFNAKLQDLKTEVTALEESIQKVDQQVRLNIDEEQIGRTVDAKYASKVSEAEQTITLSKKAREDLIGKLHSEEKKLTDLRSQKVELKKEIESTLITLDTVGTSPFLPTSFFLGFDDSENIITLDYNGDASLVLFAGTDTNVVTPFIFMAIIQYFTNMLINNLHIDIIDLENAGIAYDLFRYKELSDVVNIVASEDEEQELIRNLHTDMRTRSSRMSATASNIYDYNTKMVARDSIPMDYRVVLIQAPSDNLMRDQKFLQLCRRGATNGIIPLLFLPSSKLLGLISKKNNTNKDEVLAWCNLVKAIPNQFFNFNPDTGEVTSMGLDFKTDCLKKLTDLVNEVT